MLSRAPLVLHRIAFVLKGVGIPVVPELLTLLNLFLFHCYIGAGARIGKRVALGYGGLGVVIHASAVVGDDVVIGPGVVIGGRSKISAVPTVGSRCVIGAGAKLLGPLVVGNESVIGANSLVVRNVPKRSMVAGVPAEIIRRGIDISEYHDGLNLDERRKTVSDDSPNSPSSPTS